MDQDRSWGTVHENAHPSQAWLNRFCQSISGQEGLEIIEGLALWCDHDEWAPVAFWAGEPETDGNDLLEPAAEVRESGQGTLISLNSGEFAIAYPIRHLARMDMELPRAILLGAVALKVRLVVKEASQGGQPRDATSVLRPLMQRLEDGVAALERDQLHQVFREVNGRCDSLGAHLTLMAAVLAEPTFTAASMQLVTRLASQFNAERVSLGWRVAGRSRVVQISHSARFNRKMNRIRATETAMDEALDQARIVAWCDDKDTPSQEDTTGPVRVCHRELARQVSSPAVLSVPFFDDQRALGVILLERDRQFSEAESASLESLMVLLARALEEKRRNDRALPMKVLSSLGEHSGRLLGQGYLGYKVAALSLTAIMAFASLATGTDRVSADAVLESDQQRVIVAPFRGYILQSHVRAGDTITEEGTLAVMDTRDLRLEQLQWQSELVKLERQEQDLRGRGDRAALNVLLAQRQQAQVRLQLIESRLDRARLEAPFDGVVVKGDLTQRLGGVVEQGEELFRLSPLHEYRIELQVPETRIGDVRPGQQGRLVFSAMTRQQYRFEVDRVTPRTVSREGQNRFIVEARLLEQHPGLRPGMQAVGKVDVAEGRLVMIWSRAMMDWLRLNAWRWWG